MNEPSEVPVYAGEDAQGTHPPGADLQQALVALTDDRQRQLSALIAETRRCDELLAALDGEPAQLVEQRRAQLGQAVLELLMRWQALGGRVLLGTPDPVEPPNAEAVDAVVEPVQRAVEVAATPTPPPRMAPSTDADPPVVRPARPPTPRPPVTSPAEGWDDDLAALLGTIATSGNAQEEMDTIQRAASASFSRWAPYPRAVQRALVGNLACRLRHLQDHLGVAGGKLDSAFRSLTRFSKSFQPGWVNGLTRGRGPAAESWAEEARVWWDQLALSASSEPDRPGQAPSSSPRSRDEALDNVRSWLSEWRGAPEVAKPMCLDKTLGAIQAALDGGVLHTDRDLCSLADEIYDHLELARFRRLRQGIRDLELADREDAGLEPPEAVPSDWPWWSHTVGRRALLLGSEPDEERARQIETCFGMAGLRFRDLERVASSEADIRDLLAGTTTDIVLVVSPYPEEPAVRSVIRGCQVRGLPWVHVDRGLGVTRVRMAIERFLQPDPRAEDGQPAEP